MIKYCLAIDMGASSGRHILGHIENDKLILEEMYRFPNGPVKKDGNIVWDCSALLNEIITGMKKCSQLGKIPKTVGIDTWGVDYLLLDKNGNEIMPAYSYRDLRTEKYLNTSVPYEELYSRTGIYKQLHNSIYQLLSDKAQGRLDNAYDMLFLPEYFSYKLTGKKAKEYTIATTSGLVDAKTRQWAKDIIQRLDLPERLFPPLCEPGYKVGGLSQQICEMVGFNCDVIFPASHDTASAIAAVPAKDALYISSGTWSLLGIESTPILTSDAREYEYSNEGFLFNKIKLLKNIMGLWIIQCIKQESGKQISFTEIAEMAEQEAVYDWHIDINDNRFFSPASMIDAVKDMCKFENQPVPKSLGELSHCVYNSLAHSYNKAIDQLENLTKKHFNEIYIIGGGCNNFYLNKLTAKHTGRVVFAGPSEATAIGNIILQLLALGEIKSYDKAKEMIKGSFEINKFK